MRVCVSSNSFAKQVSSGKQGFWNLGSFSRLTRDISWIAVNQTREMWTKNCCNCRKVSKKSLIKK